MFLGHMVAPFDSSFINKCAAREIVKALSMLWAKLQGARMRRWSTPKVSWFSRL